ncbi:MAG: helix-turn-helix domain-containing protein [Deltaproteobacteria bacterium]|nr:helix-turn-helix domain-containing protein [Deltaproteobacteria bacterium]
MNYSNVKVLERQVLTPRDVAIVYGLSEGTLANWRSQRRGPKFYRLSGRKIAYFRADLEDWARREPVITRDSDEVNR